MFLVQVIFDIMLFFKKIINLGHFNPIGSVIVVKLSKLTLFYLCRNSTLFLIFSLWAVRKLIWSVSGKFSQVHKRDKIGLEKPILKFRVPKGHEKFQRLREANFVSRVNLRNFSQTLHISFLTPQRENIKTDCFFSLAGYLLWTS